MPDENDLFTVHYWYRQFGSRIWVETWWPVRGSCSTDARWKARRSLLANGDIAEFFIIENDTIE